MYVVLKGGKDEYKKNPDFSIDNSNYNRNIGILDWIIYWPDI
jgi:hypothetical protein